MDSLEEMFRLRRQFMEELASARGIDLKIPLSVEKKENQQALRDLTLKGVEEIFEALQHFKNWKSHRVSGDLSFDREAYLEEMVDSINYFFSVLIQLGFTPQDLLEAYKKKHDIIVDRINKNY